MQGFRFPTEDAALTLSQRLFRVFWAPRRSFAAIGQDPGWLEWFAPVALVCLVGVAAHYLTREVVFNPETPAIEKQLQGLSEDQRQRQLEGLKGRYAWGWAMALVGPLNSLVVVGGVLLLLARWLFRSEVTYRQMLVVKGYASLVIGVEWLVCAALILARQTPVVYTGPGVLVSEGMARTFAGQVLLGIDLFDVWQAVVIGIGTAVMAQVPVRKAVFAVLVLWGLSVMGLGVLGTLALSAGPGGGAVP